MKREETDHNKPVPYRPLVLNDNVTGYYKTLRWLLLFDGYTCSEQIESVSFVTKSKVHIASGFCLLHSKCTEHENCTNEQTIFTINVSANSTTFVHPQR